ncbi:MAG: NADH-quinone oxidoreductase subunit D [Anaerolineae bacterium]|nr:NADH-quinone oxidoreductase subunit D [Anaerolineae bacterium]
MSEQTTAATDPLIADYEGKIQRDNRTGFDGYVVPVELLISFVNRLKNERGYDYLSSITSVDYEQDGYFEVVYHLYRILGGESMTLKVRTGRETPQVPSLYHIFPGADLQEREVWDLMGIKFEGHPDLRRVLLWEGFYGHPLQKDWKEPYFEEEIKPFKSRWPEGEPSYAEDKNPFADNVQYPADFDPTKWRESSESRLYSSLQQAGASILESDESDKIIINLGPQHPSTHGVFRMVANIEGERIVGLKPAFGYLHRNHEKIGERNTFIQNIPFTDRLDYICSMSNNLGYVQAVEMLMGLQPPERAEYIRVIMAELTRVINHVFWIGFLLNDLGAFFTPSLYALEERELILDVFEEVSGSRMMCNYMRFGGVVRDISPEVLEKIRILVNDRLPRKLEDFERYLTNSEIIRARCEGIGILTQEEAIAYSASGPVLRASGVPYDIRRAEPYSIYDRFDFNVAYATHGDVYDRYLVRVQEVKESIKILKQAINDIPEGPYLAGKSQYQVRVPAGEAYGRIESPKGELGFYIVSNGKPNPWRYHVRAPSFINLTGLEKMCLGEKVADVVVILGSIDIVLGEVDR